jgi:hypothetical protein
VRVNRSRPVHTLFAVLIGAFGGAAAAQSDQALTVSESGDSYRLSLPVSRLVMTIPKGEFTVADERASGATTNPRYFQLEDRVQGVIVSGWFEPSRAYAGFDAFWSKEADALRRRGFAPVDVEHMKVDKWEAALYEQPIPKATNAHVRAEWIEEGTWIDVHISVITTDPSAVARETALNVLKGIRVAVVK